MARLITRRADHFAHWPRGAAISVLIGFALLLGAAAWTYTPRPPAKAVATSVQTTRPGKHDTDLQLYAAIAARVAKGENYYRAAVTEQRARSFPVRPGFAVRLPTLAFLTAWLGTAGLIALGSALGLATLLAWWRRLGEEAEGRARRWVALALLAGGAMFGARAHYAMLHEVWAGMFLALAFGLHRRGRWASAWLAAAAALAIREHAAPFVMLLAAMAAWRRDWRECGAWCGLLVLFGVALTAHLHMVSTLWLPSDRPSPPWLVLRGLVGWTGNLTTASFLVYLPGQLAAPLALLPLIGWAGWRSPAGLTGFLLHLGYGVLFMIAGRANNFYWAMMITPTWFIGLAFAPAALASLVRAAGRRNLTT